MALFKQCNLHLNRINLSHIGHLTSPPHFPPPSICIPSNTSESQILRLHSLYCTSTWTHPQCTEHLEERAQRGGESGETDRFPSLPHETRVPSFCSRHVWPICYPNTHVLCFYTWSYGDIHTPEYMATALTIRYNAHRKKTSRGNSSVTALIKDSPVINNNLRGDWLHDYSLCLVTGLQHSLCMQRSLSKHAL